MAEVAGFFFKIEFLAENREKRSPESQESREDHSGNRRRIASFFLSRKSDFFLKKHPYGE